MKINPNYVSLCLEYLELAKDIWDRNEIQELQHSKLDNLISLEESDFDKGIQILKESKKLDECLSLMKAKEKFLNEESFKYWNAGYFVGRLVNQATYHKRYETKNRMKEEIESKFPENEEIQKVKGFVDSVSVCPFQKINFREQAEKMGLPQEQIGALVELV